MKDDTINKEQIKSGLEQSDDNPFRKWMKKTGRKVLLGLGKFYGKQSIVAVEPILDKAQFPFLDIFEENWEDIKAEAQEILKFREDIPAFQEISPDQMRIATENNWKTFFLYGFGSKFEKSCRYAPKTAELLSKVPKLQTAWFSILAPGYHIPAHKGFSRGILRAHLGLIIPQEQEKCRLRVDDVIQVWRPGEIFVFDDTYEHEVWNDTAEERVVLLFDFDRPMRRAGRIANSLFVSVMKRTAFFQVPKNNLEAFEERLDSK